METLWFYVYIIEINANAFAVHNIYAYNEYRNIEKVFLYCLVFYDTEDRSFLLSNKGEVLPDKSKIQPRELFSAICIRKGQF